MRITYYALKPIDVHGDLREPGDLLPEVADWPFLNAYVNDGKVAPVLVATLPEEQQVMLLEWEDTQAKIAEANAKSQAKAEADRIKRAEAQKELVAS